MDPTYSSMHSRRMLEKVSSMLPHTARTMRTRRRRSIVRILDSLELTSALRGSWLYGDFHLSECGQWSHSDLDLVVHGAGANERAEIAFEVQSRLAKVIEISVSVHPADYIEVMSLADARILVIGECLANLMYRVPTGRVTADYVRAKGSLMIMRTSMRERYASVAREVGSRDALMAFFVKLGVIETFSVGACRQLLSCCSESPAVEFLRKCLCGSLDSEYVKETARLLGGVRSVDPWLRNNLLDKMRGVR